MYEAKKRIDNTNNLTVIHVIHEFCGLMPIDCTSKMNIGMSNGYVSSGPKY